MGRPTNRLSALSIKKDLPPGLYADGGGLYLQVSQQKTKAWIFRFTRAGVPRKMGLGPVSVKPDDKRITLADARQKAAAARSLLIDGMDPIEARNTRKDALAVEKAKALTFKECAEGYIEANKPGWKNAKHADQWRMTLLGVDPKGKPAKNDYCKIIRHLPVAAIDDGLVMKVLQPIWNSKTETANRVRGRIRKSARSSQGAKAARRRKPCSLGRAPRPAFAEEIPSCPRRKSSRTSLWPDAAVYGGLAPT